MQSREEVEDYAHVEPAATQTALPPLEDRLRIARQSAVSDTGEQEGFVTDQTAAKQEPSDPAPQSDAIDAPSVDQGSGESPSAAPAHSADEADQSEAGDIPGTVTSEQPAPASEPITNTTRELMRECMDKMLFVASDPNVPDAKDRRGILVRTKDAWKAELPNYPDFVRVCFETADKVVKAELQPDAAQRYLEGLI